MGDFTSAYVNVWCQGGCVTMHGLRMTVPVCVPAHVFVWFFCSAVAVKGAAYLSSAAVVAAHAAELSAAGGIITQQDLASAAPLERHLIKVEVCVHALNRP